ncbi:hypothetical protein Emed_000559 [Eimeria media]
MEAATPRADGRERGARLRSLYLQGPSSSSPGNAPIVSDVSHSSQDARLVEARRPIEHLAQKFPLKAIQNCINKAIKRKPRNARIQQVAEAPKTSPIPPRAAPGQPCMQQQPLKNQEPVLGVDVPEAADITPAITSKAVSLLPEEEQMREMEADDYDFLTTTMQDWQGTPNNRPVLFLPAVTRPVRSFQDVQDETPCMQKKQEQPAEEEVSSHSSPQVITKNADASSTLSTGGEAPPLSPPCEKQEFCSSQPGEGWETWKEWLSLQPLLALTATPPRKAEGEKSSPTVGVPCEERRSRSQGDEPLVSAKTLPNVTSLFQSQQRSDEGDASCTSPLMIMTPRVADAAPLKEGPYLEVPVNPPSEPQGLQEDGFHASLNIILRLMERIVSVLDGSTSVLAACSNVTSTDEGQLVIDASGAQDSKESSSVRDKLEEKHVAKLNTEELAACEAMGDEDRETLDSLFPEGRGKGDCRDLVGKNNTQVEPLKGSAQLVQASTHHAGNACTSTAASHEYNYLDLSREAWGPPPKISSEGSCSARGSLAEESGEPSVPVIATREFKFFEASEETQESEDDDEDDEEEVDADTTVLQVTHRAERLATTCVQHLSFSTRVTLTLPSSRTARIEQSRAAGSTDLLTILEKQAASQGLFRPQASLLPPSPEPQRQEPQSEIAISLVKANDSEKDGLWKLLREDVEAIPPMHLPAADKHPLRAPADTSCSVQSVDAVEDDLEDLETKDLMCFLGLSSGSCSTTHRAQTFVNPWQKNAEERWAPLSPLYPIHECEELDAEDEEADSCLSTK